MSPGEAEKRAGGWQAPVGIVVAFAVLLLALPPTSECFSRAEVYFAETAREMLLTGDWVTPRYCDEVFFDKPPLVYWLMALAFELLGVSLAVSRIPGIAGGIVAAAVVALFGWRYYGRRAGLIAGLVLVTAPGFWQMARTGMSDVLLTLFVATALLAWWHGLSGRNQWKPAMVVGHCALALGLLTKGPVAPVLVGLALVAALVVTRTGGLGRLFYAPALAAFLIIALPWFVAVILEHGFAFLDYFFVGEHVWRFLGKKYSTTHAPTFYIGVLLSLFAPWSLWLPPSIVMLLRPREGGQPSRPTTLFLICWILAVLVFFTLSGFRLDYYLLSAYPALALLVGAGFDRLACDTERLRRTGSGLALFTALLFGSMGVLLWLNARALFPGQSAFLSGVVLAVGGAGAAAVGFQGLGRGRFGLAVVTALGAGALLLVTNQLQNAFCLRYRPAETLARSVRTLEPPPSQLGTALELARWDARARFHSGLPVAPLPHPKAVAEFAARPGTAMLIITEDGRARALADVPHRVVSRGQDLGRSVLRLDYFRRRPVPRDVLLVELTREAVSPPSDGFLRQDADGGADADHGPAGEDQLDPDQHADGPGP